MKNTYTINFTDPAKATFVIFPHTLDGPAGFAQHSSLNLPGSALPMYGEKVNEDLLKLLENFSSPESATPVTPGATEPDHSMLAPPYTTGQIWFNSTNNIQYSYVDTLDNAGNPTGVFAWIPVGGNIITFDITANAPVINANGEFWFDTTIDQLKISHNGVWVSVAERYVLKSGDTMTGNLTVESPGAATPNGLVLNTPGVGTNEYVKLFSKQSSILTVSGSIADPGTGNGDTTYFDILQTGDAVLSQGTLSAPNAVISGVYDLTTKEYVDNSTVSLTGDTMTGQLSMSNAARIINVQDPINNQDVMTLSYYTSNIGPLLSGKVAKAGDTMSGNLDMTNSARIVHCQAPLVGDDVATKEYVDNEVHGPDVVNVNPSLALTADGDIRVSGTGITFKVEMYGDSSWHQIFPAVYAP